MFGWLKTLKGAAASAGEAKRPAPANAAYSVALTGDDISVDYPGQPRVKASLADVAEVVVETGEEETDFWWMLLGTTGNLLMAFPGGATGEDALVTRLKSLPGFDEARFADALACEITGEFIVWKRT